MVSLRITSAKDHYQEKETIVYLEVKTMNRIPCKEQQIKKSAPCIRSWCIFIAQNLTNVD